MYSWIWGHWPGLRPHKHRNPFHSVPEPESLWPCFAHRAEIGQSVRPSALADPLDLRGWEECPGQGFGELGVGVCAHTHVYTQMRTCLCWGELAGAGTRHRGSQQRSCRGSAPPGAAAVRIQEAEVGAGQKGQVCTSRTVASARPANPRDCLRCGWCRRKRVWCSDTGPGKTGRGHREPAAGAG